MRPFYLKINAKWNICTDLYPKITLSQSECSLMSHDLILSVQYHRAILILVLGIVNNVNYNCGFLYCAEPAYITHCTWLYPLYIYISILEMNVIE